MAIERVGVVIEADERCKVAAEIEAEEGYEGSLPGCDIPREVGRECVDEGRAMFVSPAYIAR